MIEKLITPVLHNIPLFFVSILLLGGFDVFYHQYIFRENTLLTMLLAYGEMMLMGYLACVTAWSLRKFHIKPLIYIVLFTIYAVNCYLRYAYSTDISPKILLLLFETNSKEISGFFKTYFLTPAMYKTVFVVSGILLMTCIGEMIREKIGRLIAKTPFSQVLLTLLIIGAIGGIHPVSRYTRLALCSNTFEAERWLMETPYRKGMPLPNLFYSLDAIRMSGKDLEYMIASTEAALQNVGCEQTDSLNIVLVIGESFNKYHSSLYGYSLDTTPSQREEQANGNLCAFTHVKAPHNMTSIVLRNVLCTNNVHEGEYWYNYPYFPAIFKKAGYDVWFWDNQYKWDPDAPWAFTLNSVIFNERIQQLSYSAINKHGYTYDDGLITDFEKKQKSSLGVRNLIIFHLAGQHWPASMQYPQDKKYQVFSPSDIKDKKPYLNDESRQRLADYANATHYNDAVIRQIMDLVKVDNSILIYFPDHGEEIYDYRDFYGRQVLGEDLITPELIKYQIEIPFVIWCSDRWKASHPEEWEAINQSQDREFSTDNICHLLFHLGGIRTKEYKQERDLISPRFVPQTKAYNMLSI